MLRFAAAAWFFYASVLFASPFTCSTRDGGNEAIRSNATEEMFLSELRQLPQKRTGSGENGEYLISVENVGTGAVCSVSATETKGRYRIDILYYKTEPTYYGFGRDVEVPRRRAYSVKGKEAVTKVFRTFFQGDTEAWLAEVDRLDVIVYSKY